MESKVVSLEVIPGHPKFLRLPSLSRSLIHSILPKSCQQMHMRPTIFSISPRSDQAVGPPQLTSPKQCKKRLFLNKISRPDNIRPNTSSYSYKKVYQSKPPTQPLLRQYFTRRNSPTQRQELTKHYYCEVTLPKPKRRHLKQHYSLLNKTNLTFMQSSEQPDDLHNIPEVGSSMESSEYNLNSLKNLELM